MILLYRITPFLMAIVSALTFAAFIFRWAHPVLVMMLGFILVLFLLARLLRFQAQSFSFWFFLGTAIIFFLSTFSILFLFENLYASVAVAILSVVLLGLFTEFVFQYVHLPATYQPFSLEYLTLLLNLLSIFFLTCFGFAVRLLVQAPLSVLAIFFFLVSFFLVYGMLWVSKADVMQARFFAFFGAILFTELFVAISYFPTGFYTNAAFMTIFAYVFFGISRAHAIRKLSPVVVKRYLITSILLLLFIGLSSQWI